ncbi:hypothetical protein LCGC14_0392810 [marine sediment metagenome]|uniref:Uncharacterized protein n=1 Tax=marine sediment metagenome TaxID=412755 RepID=A0A0F9SZ20_9ZZZZ
MAKLTKKRIEELGAIEAMVLCNELGLPEGTGEEMRQALLEHLMSGGKPSED